MNGMMGGKFERREADSKMLYNRNKGTQSWHACKCHTSALDNKKMYLLLFELIQNNAQ